MATIFNDQHLEAFQTKACIGPWHGRELSKWIRYIPVNDLGEAVLLRKHERKDLNDLCADPKIPSRDVLWAILSWGGIKIDAARRLAQNEMVWAKVVEQLREGSLDRTSSYELCWASASALPSGGIGPAYFTKLIFFANPRHDGYIMDQWTSRSVNLLVEGLPTIKMRTKANDHVDPRNTPATYERFCSIVEELSTQLYQHSPEETEQCLFSEGRKKGKWRNYLLEHGG